MKNSSYRRNKDDKLYTCKDFGCGWIFVDNVDKICNGRYKNDESKNPYCHDTIAYSFGEKEGGVVCHKIEYIPKQEEMNDAIER